MFKVKHLTKLLTIYPNKTICTRLPVSLSTNVIAASNRTNLTLTRLYSDKNATNKNTKVCKQGKEQVETHPHVEKQTKSIPDEKCSDEKIPLKQCKPIEINPCIPPSGFSPTKIPSLQECPTPNLMSESPQPGGNWDEQNKNNRKKYARILTIGLIVSAVSIAAVYFTEFTEKPTKKLSKSKKKSKISTKIPADSSQIPKHVPYLLIGGGTASFAAFRAIKSTDPQAKVLVVTTESYFPYMRPPLSKEIWYNDDKDSINKLIFKQWNGSERSLFYEPEDFYTNCEKLLDNENGGVAVARGWTVTHLDAAERRAYLDDGSTIQYDKCLIATGAKPKILPVFEAAANNDNHIRERVRLFRNIEDFKTASELFDKSNSVAVIGGGFLGSELACALARKGKKQNKNVYQIFRESGNMGKILPEYLSYWTTDKVKAEGVNVLYESDVQIVRGNKKGLELELQNGKKVNVDFVIVAVGVEPDTALAKKSNLETDPEIGGFLVNAELQARSDLYIAGDCSCFYDPLLGRRRIEHHDHAVVSGRLAGENMTGASKPYTHQSMFWSDLGPDVGYEAIGLVDSKLPTVGVFAKATVKDNPTDNNVSENISTRQSECTDEYRKKNFPNQNEGEDFSKGVIFYLKDDIVVGIVLWNVFNRMSVARQVLKDQKKYDDLNEVAKLFNIHED